MVTEIKDKDELLQISSKLVGVTSQFALESMGLIGTLGDTENFDGINISSASSTIQRNLRNVSTELESLASKFNNYILDIKAIDVYDFNEHDDINGEVLSNSKDTKGEKTFLFTEQEKNDLVIDDIDDEPLFDDEWW